MVEVDGLEVEAITKRLVEQSSITGTDGEKEMAYLIYDILRESPYFTNDPYALRLTSTREMDVERYNVLALLRAPKPTQETVILMGHFDTVGVDDYGKWKPFACSPDRLMDEWRENPIPKAVKRDLESGEWLNGRGSLDMKSGIASHIYLMKYFAKHREKLKGNVLLVVTCDEENNSTGILSAIQDINRIAEEQNLSYIAAINSDYTSSRYEGDESRYVYVGTVGKLLPTFFVAGTETHVGQAFDGFDPNFLLSELTRCMDYQVDLCDEVDGEVTLPPLTLKQTDLKVQYDVQTPKTGFVYYNFFVHGWSPEEVLYRCQKVAIQAFENAISVYEERSRQYCVKSGIPYSPSNLFPRVYTYHDYLNEWKQKLGSTFEYHIEQMSQELLKENMDVREYSKRMVEEVWRYSGDPDPVIILFYSPPYIPRVALNDENRYDRRLISALQESVQKVQPFYPKTIQVRKFFPYISDMSYVAMSDSETGIQTLVDNMPAWGKKYSIDVDAIRQLNVPVMNIGPYGRDAHKQWERVEKEFSMKIVPYLTIEVIQTLFEKSS